MKSFMYCLRVETGIAENGTDCVITKTEDTHINLRYVVDVTEKNVEILDDNGDHKTISIYYLRMYDGSEVCVVGSEPDEKFGTDDYKYEMTHAMFEYMLG